MIFDLTILTVSNRFLEDKTANYNTTIKFPNDKKLYQAALKIYFKNQLGKEIWETEFAILTVSICILILIMETKL